MSLRDSFIEYVKNGSNKPIVSLQIGAGAGFDTKLAGKIWNSEATLQDTINAYEIAGGYPLFNIGLPDISKHNPDFTRETKTENKEEERISEAIILISPITSLFPANMYRIFISYREHFHFANFMGKI